MASPPRLRSVPTSIRPVPSSVPAPLPPAQAAPAQVMAPGQQSGWWWDGTRWVCDPCDDFPQGPFPCPSPGWPTPCPPWFPPPAGQAPWYPGANGGVSFSQTPPVNPTRGNFWWDGVMLHMFDGAAWVNIGPTAGGGVATGPVPPSAPVTGQLWFDGVVLFVWNGTGWVSTMGAESFVQPTAPTNPDVGDLWWDGAHQWVWDGSVWQLVGGTGAPATVLPSIAPVQIPWSANIVPDFSQFINAYINITGNFILGSPINVRPGQTGIIKLNQDVVGGHTWLVSPGWYFLGGTGAPALSTGANARDLLHYYVGEQSIVYGELHVDFMSNSGGTAPPVVTATNIGNMTLNGGLAAGFDGNNQKAQAACARASFPNVAPGSSVSSFIGLQYSAPQRILSATYWPSNDVGKAGGMAFSAGFQDFFLLSVNLRGLTGATPPATSSAGTLLATHSYGTPPAVGQTIPASFQASAALVPNDMNTAFTFVWAEIVVANQSGNNASATIDTFCAQLIIDHHT